MKKIIEIIEYEENGNEKLIETKILKEEKDFIFLIYLLENFYSFNKGNIIK